MSQKQRNESYSLCPHGPPFTDISCGFFLNAFSDSLNRKKIKKAGFIGGGGREKEKKRAGEEGKAEPSSTLLYLFRPESEALQNKASALLTNIYLFVCLKKPWLGVRCPPNLSVLGGKSTFPVMIHGLAQDHSSRFSSQWPLFTKSSNRCA